MCSTVADNKNQFSCRALRQHAQLKEAGRLSVILEPLTSLLYLYAALKNEVKDANIAPWTCLSWQPAFGRQPQNSSP